MVALAVLDAREDRRQAAKAVIRQMLAARPVRGAYVSVQHALEAEPDRFESGHYNRVTAPKNTAASVYLYLHGEELRDAIAHGLPKARALDSVRHLEALIRHAYAEQARGAVLDRALDAHVAEQRPDSREDEAQIRLMRDPHNPTHHRRWLALAAEEIAVKTVAMDASREFLATVETAQPPSHQPPSAA